MKVRIILKARKNWGILKIGYTMTVYNNVLNAFNGIGIFPIDASQWAVVRCDLFTGVNDLKGKEIYENDKIKIKDNPVWITKDNPENIGTVKFKEGKFYSDGTNTKYDIGAWQKKIEVVENK